MEIKQVKSKGLNHKFDFIIDAKDIESRIQDHLQNLQKTAKISGFRPGKAPMHMLEKKYGASARGNVLEDLIKEGSKKALEEHKVEPATRPSYDVKDYKEGEPFTFSMEVEAMPEIKIQDFSKIKLNRLKVKLADKDIEETLEDIAKAQNQTEVVKKARATKEGDVIVVDMKGFFDDKENTPIDGAEAENYPLELGTNKLLAEMEKDLLGKKLSETVELKFAFPKDFQDKAVAGKKVRYELTVKEHREPVATKINEDLAKQLGFESLDKLREAVSEKMTTEYDSSSFFHAKRNLLDSLDDTYSFDLPTTMVENEFNSIWTQRENQMKSEDKKPTAKEEKADKEKFQKLAERRVRLGLLLAHIGRENKLEVSRDALVGAIMERARSYPGQEKQVMEYYQKNPEALESIRAPLFEDEVIRFVLDKSKVTEKEVTTTNFKKEMEKLSESA